MSRQQKHKNESKYFTKSGPHPRLVDQPKRSLALPTWRSDASRVQVQFDHEKKAMMYWSDQVWVFHRANFSRAGPGTEYPEEG
jgi:hypothetical protein